MSLIKYLLSNSAVAFLDNLRNDDTIISFITVTLSLSVASVHSNNYEPLLRALLEN